MPTADPNGSSSSLPAIIFVVLGITAVLGAVAVTTNTNEAGARLATAPEYGDASRIDAQPAARGGGGSGGVVDRRTARLRHRLSHTTVLDEHTLRRILNEFGTARDGSPTASVWLVRALTEFVGAKDEDRNVRRAAVALLARIDRSHLVVDPFVDLFDDPDPIVRAEAIGGRARHGLSGYLNAAIRLVTDSDVNVRIAVARALGTIQDTHAATGLLTLLFDADRAVARAAAKSLARIWRGPLPTRIVEAAGADEATTRLAVAIVLRDLRSQQSTNLLAELCVDPDWQVREAAVDALGRVRSQTAGVAAARLLGVAYDKTAARNDRFEALQALTRLGAAASDPRLAEIAIGSSDPLLRLFACRTALAHGDLRVLDSLVELLEVRTGPLCDDEDMQFIHRVAWETLRAATGLRVAERDAASWKRELVSLQTRTLDELPTYKPAHLDSFR